MEIFTTSPVGPPPWVAGMMLQFETYTAPSSKAKPEGKGTFPGPSVVRAPFGATLMTAPEGSGPNMPLAWNSVA